MRVKSKAVARSAGSKFGLEQLEQRRLFSASVFVSPPGKPHVIDPAAEGANDITWNLATDSDQGAIYYTVWYERIGSKVASSAGSTTKSQFVLSGGAPNDPIMPSSNYAVWVFATDNLSGITRKSPLTLFRTENALTPSAIEKAYGLNSVYKGGNNGAGETIGLVELGSDPTLAADIADFDSIFHLSKPDLEVINSAGAFSPQPLDTDPASEIALDVEWTHAIAPGARIVVVEAPDTVAGLLAASNEAVAQGTAQAPTVAVSMSYGFSSSSITSAGLTPLLNPDSNFQASGVSYVAAAGDYFSYSAWPSVSSSVLSVGGTQLSVNPSDPAQAQVEWQDATVTDYLDKGSGSGYGNFDPTVDPTPKQTPDVTYAAIGYYFYHSGKLTSLGYGTSFGAPQWAAIIALADQARAKKSLPSFSSNLSAPATQQLQTALDNAPATDFGMNSASQGQPAEQGLSFETGLGSPTGALIQDLMAYTGPVNG